MPLSIRKMQKDAFKIAHSKGFHPQGRINTKKLTNQQIERICARLMLIVTEVAEACEDVRDGKMELMKEPDTIPYEEGLHIYQRDNPKAGKPIGFPSELADIVVRVGDLAEETGVDLQSVIEQKMKYNKTRGWKHFKKI